MNNTKHASATASNCWAEHLPLTCWEAIFWKHCSCRTWASRPAKPAVVFTMPPQCLACTRSAVTTTWPPGSMHKCTICFACQNRTVTWTPVGLSDAELCSPCIHWGIGARRTQGQSIAIGTACIGTTHLPLQQVLRISLASCCRALLVELLTPSSCSSFGSKQLLLSHLVLLLHLSCKVSSARRSSYKRQQAQSSHRSV